MTTKHTQGPWFADEDGRIWRRPLSELYERGGTVAGDKPIAVVYKGWYGKDEKGYPVEANASLIAAAPELLETLQLAADYIDGPTAWTKAQEDVLREKLYAAIAKATGEQE